MLEEADTDQPRHHPAVPMVRSLGIVNWRGLWTLYLKEVQRFIKVFTQTVAAPVVTTLLFFTIFTVALGASGRVVGDTTFSTFLAPGLIMMVMMQNAFANTSSSIMISKIQGNIVDVLMPPLSAGEMMLAYAAGGVTRGVLVGLTTGLVLALFVTTSVHSLPLVLFHAVAASLMLSLLGMIGGIWADRFDHMAAITNFVIMPFSFLSGTFYSIQRLPEVWQLVAQFNPFFYMIDGFRTGFIGVSDASPAIGIVVMLGVNALLLGVTYQLLASGYKLKA